MRRAIPVLLIVALTACASVYDSSYQAETDRLEAQQAAHEATEKAAHAEASRYAAVVYFAVGSAALDDDARQQLRWFVGKMQPYPQARILVQGFADSTGSEPRNVDLSTERAKAVSAYLAEQGMPKDHLITQGFSSNYPAGSNLTAEGRNRNRRVEVTVR